MADLGPLHVRDPHAWLLACEEIRQLASRYAVALSRGDLDTVVALFVDDVQLGRGGDGGGEHGHAALRASFEELLAPLRRQILQVSNHVIDVVDADHASGVVGTRAELEIDGHWVVQLIEYHDTYRRTANGWRFVRRRHRLWYGAPLGESPLGQSPAHWPDSAVGTGDLWE